MAYIDDVIQLYAQQLGRAPDADGLTYWTNALANGGSVYDLVNAMQASPEAHANNTAAGITWEPISAPQTTPVPSTPAPATPSGPAWNDIISLADNTLSRNGNNYADSIYIPGLGQVNVTRGDGQTYGKSGITGLQLHDPTRDGQGLGGGFYLTPNADGTLSKTPYDYKNGFWDYALPIMAAAVTAGGMTGAIPSTLAPAGGASGAAAGAGGWISAEGGAGYLSGMAADASELAAAGGLTAASVGEDQLANEWSKLVAQNAATPGSLLPTTLPTIDLATASILTPGVTQLLDGTVLPNTSAIPPINSIPGTPTAPVTLPPVTSIPGISPDTAVKAATAVAGAAAATSGATESGKTTTTIEPWSEQQPYLKDLYANAQNIFNANKNPSAAENWALNVIQQRAGAGSPLQTAAKSNIQGLLGQDPTQAYGIGQTNQYLGQNINVGTNPMLGMDNPFLQTAIDSAQQDVVRAMQPQFASAQRASGSFGNSGLQETYARELPKALGNISNSMRMTDYTNQQQLQESALNRSVAAQQSDLARNSTLAQQGIQNNIGQYNTLLGLQTDAAYRAPGLAAADYNDPQMAYNTALSARQSAFMPLQQYQSAIGGSVGQTQSSPYFTNPAANILGGATAGLSLYNAAQKSGLFGGGGTYNSWLGNNADWMTNNGITPGGLLSSF